MKTKRVLCAVLASPPTTSGERTRAALRLAAGLLDCDELRIVNLLPVATNDVNAMTRAGVDAYAWRLGRPELLLGLQSSDLVLAAWGVSRLSGPARIHQRAQIDWLVSQGAPLHGDGVWIVGDQPRHPSRWHQYVSDKHGRTLPSGNTRSRLRQVITQVPWTHLLLKQLPQAPSEVSRVPAPRRETVERTPCKPEPDDWS